MVIFCKHNWRKVNEFVIDSEFDLVVRANRTPNTWNSLKRKYITDYTCTECGKLKRFIEKTIS